MAAKLTRLTHKIAIQLHLVAESCTICRFAPDDQSGNFWIHSRISPYFYMDVKRDVPRRGKNTNYRSLKIKFSGRDLHVRRMREVRNSGYYITRHFVIFSHLVLLGHLNLEGRARD
jgi:hypothetical protein